MHQVELAGNVMRDVVNLAGPPALAGDCAQAACLFIRQGFHLGRRAQVSGRSLILKAADNPPNYASIINGLAQSSGAEVFGSDTSWWMTGQTSEAAM